MFPPRHKGQSFDYNMLVVENNFAYTIMNSLLSASFDALSFLSSTVVVVVVVVSMGAVVDVIAVEDGVVLSKVSDSF